MADLKISAAPPNPAPVGTDSLATNKAGVDFQTTLTQILSLITLPESPQGLGVWKYRTETGEPPASGQIRFNNADISSATELYIAETNSGGPTDVSLFLDILLVPGAILYIQDKTVSANNVLVECGAVTDEGTYRKVIIANILENGTEPTNNTDVIFVIGIAPSGVVEVNDLSAIVTWDDIPDANVPESAVTQHQAALAIIESQITGAQFTNWNSAFGWGNHALAGYLTSFTETNDLTAAVVWANIPDANVPESAVTQHQAALAILRAQLTDLATVSQAEAEAGTATDDRIWTAERVQQAIAALGGGGGGFPEYLFRAGDFDNPNNADWEINALAPAAADSNNASLTVRLFDDASAEGVGMSFKLPATATSLTLETVSRAETAPGGASVVKPRIHIRTIGDNAAVPSPPLTQLSLTDIDIPTNENFQYDSQTITFAALSLTAGDYVQFEYSRNPTHPNDDLTGDWDLLSILVSFA